jgi:hypothetical protein
MGTERVPWTILVWWRRLDRRHHFCIKPSLVEIELIRATRKSPMADSVDFRARLRARQTKDTEYLERLDLTAKMIPVMVETVETFTHMGASREHIVRLLRATIEELQSVCGKATET